MKIRRYFFYGTIASFVILIAYEAYEVKTAMNKLPSLFSKYETVSTNELGIGDERLELLVKLQDPTFYSHSGIEWPSPLTTTTITQSLVKRLFFEKFTPGFNKIKQTLIAWLVVNPNIDKLTQLKAFIATAIFFDKEGQLIVGFKQASMVWFNKNIETINEEEYLLLIAMLPAPNVNRPGTMASNERVARLKRVLNGTCRFDHVSQIKLSDCN